MFDKVNNDLVRGFVESVQHPMVADGQFVHAAPLPSQRLWSDGVKVLSQPAQLLEHALRHRRVQMRKSESPSGVKPT